MSILTNGVVVSVLVMCLLCLLRLNVLLSIIIAALLAGLLSPLSPQIIESSIIESTLQKLTLSAQMLIKGMAGNLDIALSYILLGAIAAAISRTHLMTFLLSFLAKSISNKKFIFILSIALISCFSQNLIPIHIAFIPILIPPLLSLMNRLKIDRRAVACALTFGLQAPYVTFGIGFGLIFHSTIRNQMEANGVPVTLSQIASVMWIGGAAMLFGLLFAVFVLYRAPREYRQSKTSEIENAKMGHREYASLFGIIMLFVAQIATGSLVLGAFIGLMCMIIFGGIKWRQIDSIMEGGLKMMAFIAFVMLVAAGFGEILRQSGEVNALINSVAGIFSDIDSIESSFYHRLIGAILMLVIGLLITMGIGTSFGTIPIIASIYVPFGVTLGFSIEAIILLIGIAGALGDAGSPASDSTLGPTSGLNADLQHNHIYDTCIPTFIAYNIPLLIAGTIGAMLL
ncbi:sodium:proton antiporter [Helicobacter jaachi]|uniref:Sodium:proton antiporter n=1 Tax=Helicobacter jaachi TaxID=1677920 RepID=A0A4U8TEN4_9HELI|nr:Na+/H+ antiporter NhaC family protein [Helicobacter jaachi]TLD97818.1 sodium:proton antiporter [Helicobacter jaachi]